MLDPRWPEKSFFEGSDYDHESAVCLQVTTDSLAPKAEFFKSFPQHAKRYRVTRGESIQIIAEQLNLEPSLIFDMHSSRCTFSLQNVATVVIPDLTIRNMKHCVASESDPLKIAHYYGVSLDALMYANLQCYRWVDDGYIDVPCFDNWLKANEGRYFSVTQVDYRPNCVAFDQWLPHDFKKHIEKSNVLRRYPPYVLVCALPDVSWLSQIKRHDNEAVLPPGLSSLITLFHAALECLLQNQEHHNTAGACRKYPQICCLFALYRSREASSLLISLAKDLF